MRRSPFDVRSWTLLTWLGAVWWSWRGFAANYVRFPVSVYARESNGELVVLETFGANELPFDIGWPYPWIGPSQLVLGIQTGPQPLATAGASPATLGLNICIIVLVTAALVYSLQKLFPKFSIKVLLFCVAAYGGWLGMAPRIVELIGFTRMELVVNSFYFFPIPLAIAAKVSDWVDWDRFRNRFVFSVLRPSESFDSASECLAAASKLDQAGDWDRAVEIFQIVAEKWPEHEAFARNCIAHIEEKRLT